MLWFISIENFSHKNSNAPLFTKKQLWYCDDPGVFGCIVKYFNLNINLSLLLNLPHPVKLHTLVPHHKDYNLTKRHNS